MPPWRILARTATLFLSGLGMMGQADLEVKQLVENHAIYLHHLPHAATFRLFCLTTPDQRRYLPTAARPAIPPASHGRRTNVAMPRHAGQRPPPPQQQQQPQQQPYRIRREVGDDRMGRYSAAYEDRREELLEQDVFGFMGPCWSLLERARSYLDQVRQLLPSLDSNE